MRTLINICTLIFLFTISVSFAQTNNSEIGSISAKLFYNQNRYDQGSAPRLKSFRQPHQSSKASHCIILQTLNEVQRISLPLYSSGHLLYFGKRSNSWPKVHLICLLGFWTWCYLVQLRLNSSQVCIFSKLLIFEHLFHDICHTINWFSCRLTLGHNLSSDSLLALGVRFFRRIGESFSFAI